MKINIKENMEILPDLAAINIKTRKVLEFVNNHELQYFWSNYHTPNYI